MTNKLLIKDPKERIGYVEGVREAMKQDWFFGFDWQKFSKKQLESPFKPMVIEVKPRLVLNYYWRYLNLTMVNHR